MAQFKIKVMIADDNIEFCSILEEYLSSMPDFEIGAVTHNGRGVLDSILKIKPDLLILDMVMPHLDGLAVLEHLKNMDLNPRPRIIVISAVGRDKITQESFASGADYYILKPFDFKILASRIRELFSDFTANEVPNNSGVINAYLNMRTGNNTLELEEQVTNIIRKIGISQCKRI